MAADTFTQGPVGGKDCLDVCVKEFDPTSVVNVDIVAVAPSVSIGTTPSGLKTNFRITTMIVPDTSVALPAVALVARNAMSITNQDATEILYIGKITVTADSVVGTTSGWETGPGESFNVDVTDAIVLYGIAPAGKTIKVKILEIS